MNASTTKITSNTKQIKRRNKRQQNQREVVNRIELTATI